MKLIFLASENDKQIEITNPSTNQIPLLMNDLLVGGEVLCEKVQGEEFLSIENHEEGCSVSIQDGDVIYLLENVKEKTGEQCFVSVTCACQALQDYIKDGKPSADLMWDVI